MRHNLDHYRLFLAGLGGGFIDYDARDRDSPVERDRGAAAAAVRALVTGLAALPREALGRAVRVRQQPRVVLGDAVGQRPTQVQRADHAVLGGPDRQLDEAGGTRGPPRGGVRTVVEAPRTGTSVRLTPLSRFGPGYAGARRYLQP